jgi:hypothetical protein
VTRNWLNDIPRTGRSMRGIRRFIKGEGSRKLTEGQEKMNGGLKFDCI